jgi:hypothetical protein
MVDAWLETEKAAPKIADLVHLAATVRSKPELPTGCEVCRGEPFIANDSRAARCTCARGKALREMDRRREQETIRAKSNLPASNLD